MNNRCLDINHAFMHAQARGSNMFEPGVGHFLALQPKLSPVVSHVGASHFRLVVGEKSLAHFLWHPLPMHRCPVDFHGTAAFFGWSLEGNPSQKSVLYIYIYKGATGQLGIPQTNSRLATADAECAEMEFNPHRKSIGVPVIRVWMK